MTKLFTHPITVHTGRAPVCDCGHGCMPHYGGCSGGNAHFEDLLADIIAVLRQYQSIGVPDYITADLNCGQPWIYPRGAMVRDADGVVYWSLVDDNSDTPPSDHWFTLQDLKDESEQAVAAAAQAIAAALAAQDSANAAANSAAVSQGSADQSAAAAAAAQISATNAANSATAAQGSAADAASSAAASQTSADQSAASAAAAQTSETNAANSAAASQASAGQSAVSAAAAQGSANAAANSATASQTSETNAANSAAAAQGSATASQISAGQSAGSAIAAQTSANAAANSATASQTSANAAQACETNAANSAAASQSSAGQSAGSAAAAQTSANAATNSAAAAQNSETNAANSATASQSSAGQSAASAAAAQASANAAANSAAASQSSAGQATGSATAAQTSASNAAASAAAAQNSEANAANSAAQASTALNSLPTGSEMDSRYAAINHTHPFAAITNKPTTLAGYGITDAVPVDNPTFTGIVNVDGSIYTEEGFTTNGPVRVTDRIIANDLLVDNDIVSNSYVRSYALQVSGETRLDGPTMLSATIVYGTTTLNGPLTVNDSAFVGDLTVRGQFNAPNGSVLNSPTLTGVPTAPTAATGNNSTQLATTAFVQQAMSNSQFGTQCGPQAGDLRGLRTYVKNNSAQQITFTIDTVVVVDNASGNSYRLHNQTLTIGMGIGLNGFEAPGIPGHYSIYVMYNPTTKVVGLLASHEAYNSGDTYNGSGAPAGFTASGKISCWLLTSNSCWEMGYQIDRKISGLRHCLYNSTWSGTMIQQGYGGQLPDTAKTVSFSLLTVPSVVMGNWTSYVYVINPQLEMYTPPYMQIASGSPGCSVTAEVADLPIAPDKTLYISYPGANVYVDNYVSGYTI